MGFDKRENARSYTPQDGDTLHAIAERETMGGNPITWQELARFNWGTDEEAEVNAFLRDELGCRERDEANNFIISSADEPRGQLLIPVRFTRRNLALENTYTLRVRRRVAPPQFLECCHIPGMSFAFNSSFIRPTVVGYLKKLEVVAGRHPEAKVMIFGHTDAVGDDLYNKKLSERRAWSVFAFITNDPDAWEVLYNHPDEDWKLAVIQEILADLGHEPGLIDGDWGPETRTAIRSFLGLPENAPVQNDATFRKQLFSAYMASKHDVHLPRERFVDPGYMGCGEYNPLIEDPDQQEQNRRVTFYFFHPDRPPTLPCAFADVAPCGKQITAAGPRFRDTFRCSFFDSLARKCQANRPITQVGCVWVRLDLSLSEITSYDFDFHLFATDGAYYEVRNVARDAVSAGIYIDLPYDHAPGDRRYTLQKCTPDGEVVRVLFEDVPFEAIGALSEQFDIDESDQGLHGDAEEESEALTGEVIL